MTDDLVKRIEWYNTHNERIMPQDAKAAVDRIKELEAVLRNIIENQWHLSIQWAASVAEDALAGEKKDD